MAERTFTVHQAYTTAGISRDSLNQWLCRGDFVPLHNPPVPGVARPYTVRDIVHLAAMTELTAAGIPLGAAVGVLGASPMETAGRECVSARRGNVEIRVDLTAVTERVRAALL